MGILVLHVCYKSSPQCMTNRLYKEKSVMLLDQPKICSSIIWKFVREIDSVHNIINELVLQIVKQIKIIPPRHKKRVDSLSQAKSKIINQNLAGNGWTLLWDCIKMETYRIFWRINFLG